MKRIILAAAAAALALSASAQTKIGHVNYMEVVQLMPEADAARTTMAAAQKEAEDTFQEMYQEYQGKMQQYQQKSATWTATIKESKEKELVEIQNRLQEFQQQVSQELDDQQRQLFAPIQEKAQEAVKKLAKEKGIAVVFDSSSALFFDETSTVDLTAAVRKAVNIPDGRTLETLQQELAAQQQQQK